MRWNRAVVIYTVGHSTLALHEFLALLHGHHIERLVDVRRFPGSRRHPHFGSAALERSLREAGIRYTHEPDLGGRRSAAAASPNAAWRSAAFRGYADHMATPAFQSALERLLDDAAGETTAIMCAEAVPWRCHRQLIADALVARGHEVRHITSTTRADPHRLNAYAVVDEQGTVTYPGSPEQPSLL